MSSEIQHEQMVDEAEKRAYKTPSLTALGKVAELVRHNDGVGEDGGIFDSDTAS